MTGLTIFLGAWRLTVPTQSRPLLAIAFAAFVGNALEGAIIDSDHWRHTFLLMGVVWGLIAATERYKAHAGEPAADDRLPSRPSSGP